MVINVHPMQTIAFQRDFWTIKSLGKKMFKSFIKRLLKQQGPEQHKSRVDELLVKSVLKDATRPSYLIQIGAGAGDRDSRADFRDGFLEHVKKAPLTDNSRILLVEPNPFNLEKLAECW